MRSAEEWAQDALFNWLMSDPYPTTLNSEKPSEHEARQRRLMTDIIAGKMRDYARECVEAWREKAARLVENHRRYYPHPRFNGRLVAKSPKVWQVEVAAALRALSAGAMMRSAHKSPKAVMTPVGKRQLIHKWSSPSNQVTTGVLIGWSRDGQSILIRRDQHESVESYHPSFWKVVE